MHALRLSRLSGSALLALLAAARPAIAQDEMFELIRKIEVDDVKGQIDSCEFSKDNRLIAAADNHATAKIYDRATGAFIQQVRHIVINNTEFKQEGKVNALGFSYDGAWLYTGINDRGLKLWNTDTWELVHHFGDGNNVDAADFSPDGKWFVMAAGKQVWIYDATTLTKIDEYEHTLGEVNNLDFSFDSQYLVSCGGSGEQGDVKLVRTSDFSEVRSHDINGSVKRVFFSPDGEYYAAGARNQLLKVFRAEDGVLVADLKHRGSLVTLPGDDFSDTNVGIETLNWSLDNQYLFTGSVKDGTLRLFRRADWSFVGYVQAQQEGRQIEYIDVNAENELLVGGDEGMLYHFAFTPAPVLRTFRALPNAGDTFAIEVEHFDTNLPQGGSAWEGCTDAGASGAACLRAGPEAGRSVPSDYQTFDPRVDSPKLDYRIEFESPGRYFVWLRGRGSIGSGVVHVGLREQELQAGRGVRLAGATPREWIWQAENGAGERISVEIEDAGEHTLNLWMGEDGVEIDKILLTPDEAFVPQDLGPAESPRGDPQDSPEPQEPQGGGAGLGSAGGGAASAAGSGGMAPDSHGGSGASSETPSREQVSDESSCACSVPGAPSRAPAALLLALALALLRWRRQSA